MDARITKQRLGNLLSYDWLKILVSVAAAVFALVLFFTMVGTRPAQEQVFTIYCHESLSVGQDFQLLGPSLENKDVFSYEILSIETESFFGNDEAAAAYNMRRAAGNGTVYFVPDVSKYDDDGNLIESETSLVQITGGAAFDGNYGGAYYDTKYYLEDCEKYLGAFFDEDGNLNEAAAEKCFHERNDGDKRFRSEASKQEGIKLEKERLQKLYNDYNAVKKAFEDGKLSHIQYETKLGKDRGTTYSFAISLSGLSVSKLASYKTAEGEPVVHVALMVLHNGYDGDLRFETVSFLKFLVEKYGSENS